MNINNIDGVDKRVIKNDFNRDNIYFNKIKKNQPNYSNFKHPKKIHSRSKSIITGYEESTTLKHKYYEFNNKKERMEEIEAINNNGGEYVIQVEGINDLTDEKWLNDVFGIVGNLLSCKIINENDNNSRYALVKYSSEKSAKRAIEKLNNAKIKGSKVSVNWYIEIPKNHIILENLPSNIEKERLINICSIIGEIESIKIEHPCNANERSRCLITFVDEESIETAKEIFEDSIIDGLKTKIVVGRYKYLKENSNKNKKGCIIEVDGLGKDVNEKTIRDIFGIIGCIESCKVIDFVSKYALIEYSTELSANIAIEKFNGKRIRGSEISVRKYYELPPNNNKKNKILLDNLPYNITEQTIIDKCSSICIVDSIQIQHPIDARGKSKCEIIIKDNESFKMALVLFADWIIDSLPIKVFIEEDDEKPHSAPIQIMRQPKIKDNIKRPVAGLIKLNNPLYVIRQSLIITNFSVDEIKEIFNKYNIKSISKLPNKAYRIYLSEQEIELAMNKLNGTFFNNKRINLSWGDSRRFKRDLHSIFVGCLDENINEDDLISVFSKVGEIYSLRIFRNKVNISKDYAYIIFKDKESVEIAIRELNGTDINGRFITVQNPKRKNDIK